MKCSSKSLLCHVSYECRQSMVNVECSSRQYLVMLSDILKKCIILPPAMPIQIRNGWIVSECLHMQRVTTIMLAVSESLLVCAIV